MIQNRDGIGSVSKPNRTEPNRIEPIGSIRSFLNRSRFRFGSIQHLPNPNFFRFRFGLNSQKLEPIPSLIRALKSLKSRV
jgi:hypothetical protein